MYVRARPVPCVGVLAEWECAVLGWAVARFHRGGGWDGSAERTLWSNERASDFARGDVRDIT